MDSSETFTSKQYTIISNYKTYNLNISLLSSEQVKFTLTTSISMPNTYRRRSFQSLKSSDEILSSSPDVYESTYTYQEFGEINKVFKMFSNLNEILASIDELIECNKVQIKNIHNSNEIYLSLKIAVILKEEEIFIPLEKKGNSDNKGNNINVDNELLKSMKSEIDMMKKEISKLIGIIDNKDKDIKKLFEENEKIKKRIIILEASAKMNKLSSPSAGSDADKEMKTSVTQSEAPHKKSFRDLRNLSSVGALKFRHSKEIKEDAFKNENPQLNNTISNFSIKNDTSLDDNLKHIEDDNISENQSNKKETIKQNISGNKNISKENSLNNSNSGSNSKSNNNKNDEEKEIKSEENKNVEVVNNKENEPETTEFLTNGDIIKSKKELDLISNKIINNEQDKKVLYVLLYKGTRDGDSANTFHQKCDGIPNQLVVVQTKKGQRFGGYTSHGFDSTSNGIKDSDAFLFSLDKMETYDAIKGKETITCESNYGPCFGWSSDLAIPDKFFTNPGEVQKRYNRFQTKLDFELTGGDPKFDFEEVEVFQALIDNINEE